MIFKSALDLERVGRLQTLANKYGDFKVAIAHRKKDGAQFWSKYKSVLECWEEGDKGLWFLAHANNRQILPCEIVIDLDINPTLEQLHRICDNLEKMSEHYEAYFTGSKGYHIHVWGHKLATLRKGEREQFRKMLLAFCNADLMKSSDHVMIALENCPHWKTGNKKTLVRSYPNGPIN